LNSSVSGKTITVFSPVAVEACRLMKTPTPLPAVAAAEEAERHDE
jgi:hypothetical protein